jgi:shikimate dehydrogenase
VETATTQERQMNEQVCPSTPPALPGESEKDYGPHGIRYGGTGCLVGLVGTEIASSRSWEIQQREADSHGLRLIYRSFDLRHCPNVLASVLESAALLGFAGLNVTHPFKQAVLPLLSDVREDAHAIGAVNTLVRSAEGWIGYNTDSAGFGQAFARYLPTADLSHVVQVGAGGAGAATALAILKLGAHRLTLLDSNPGRAEALTDTLNRLFGSHRVQVRSAVADVIGTASGLINASPVGMEGHPGTAVEPSLLRPDMWVSDVVYFPRDTELIKAARAAGCATIDGAGMAVFQAAAAFELFTSLTADRERMLAGFA